MNMRSKTQNAVTTAVSLCCSILLISSVHAQEATSGTDAIKPDDPIATDRPDFTDSPDVIPAGRVQVEGGYTLTRNGGDREHGFGEVLVRLPVGSRAEVRIGLPSYVMQRGPSGHASGWSDSFLGAKFALSGAGSEAKKAKRLRTGVLVGTTLPTGSDTVDENRFQPQAKFAVSFDLSEQTQLSANLGYARATDSGSRFDQVFGSVSLSHNLTEKIGSYVEVYGFDKADAQGDSARYFDSGLTYLLNNDLQLDIRAGVGINNHVAGADCFTGAGISRRF